MEDQDSQRRRVNPVLAFLLGIAVVAAGVLGYLYYESQKKVVDIKLPGVDVEVGKD
jgi:hypothetical protein